MAVDFGIILAYVIGLFLLFVLGRLLLVPLRIVLKLALNALLGAIAIILVNLIGGLFGFHLALNIFTAFIVGTLGVPGFILLLLLKLILL